MIYNKAAMCTPILKKSMALSLTIIIVIVLNGLFCDAF